MLIQIAENRLPLLVAVLISFLCATEALANDACSRGHTTFSVRYLPLKKAPRTALDLRLRALARRFGFEPIEVLGDGKFGRIYLIYLPDTGEFSALKVNRRRYAHFNQREAEISQQLVSKYLKRYPSTPRQQVPFLNYTFFPEDTDYHPLMPAHGDALVTLLREFGSAPNKIQRTHDVADQIIRAVHLAEKSDILLQDVKPDNILVDDDSEIKLVDFGLAIDLLAARDPGVSGTPGYMPLKAYTATKPIVGGDAAGLQQTLRNLYLESTAEQIGPEFASTHRTLGWGKEYWDYDRSPHSIDERVPETRSAAMWMPWSSVDQFWRVWKKAKLFEQDPASFYRWLGEELENDFRYDVLTAYQRIGSSIELLNAREKHQLRFSEPFARKMRAARINYRQLRSGSGDPAQDPLPIIREFN